MAIIAAIIIRYKPASQSAAATSAASAAGAPPSVFLPLRFRPCSTRHLALVCAFRVSHCFDLLSGRGMRCRVIRLCLHLPHLPPLFVHSHPYFFHFVDPPRSEIDRTRSPSRSFKGGRTMGVGGVVTRIGRGLWTSRVASDWLLQMGRP